MATSVGSFVLFSNYLSPLHSTPTHESAAQLQKVGLPLQSKRHHSWVKQLSKWTSGLSTALSDSSPLKSTGLWTILQINKVHPNWMAGRSVLWGSVLSRHGFFVMLAGYFNLRTDLDEILWVFRFWAKSGS